MTRAGKLDHIGVGASQLSRGRDIFARYYVSKINKIPEFYIIFARKSNKIPELYTHLPENAQMLSYVWPKNILGDFFFGGGGRSTPFPNLLRLWLGPRPPAS